MQQSVAIPSGWENSARARADASTALFKLPRKSLPSCNLSSLATARSRANAATRAATAALPNEFAPLPRAASRSSPTESTAADRAPKVCCCVAAAAVTAAVADVGSSFVGTRGRGGLAAAASADCASATDCVHRASAVSLAARRPSPASTASSSAARHLRQGRSVAVGPMNFFFFQAQPRHAADRSLCAEVDSNDHSGDSDGFGQNMIIWIIHPNKQHFFDFT